MKLTLNDVPLEEGSVPFTWPYVPGPEVPEAQFVVTLAIDEKLRELTNPVELSFETTIESGTRARKHTVSWKNLYLTKRVQFSPTEARWSLSDVRWLYQDVRVTGQFNVPKRVDELNIPNFATVQRAEDFIQIADQKYRAGTLKDPSGPFFAAPYGLRARIDGVPWTAFTAIMWLLSGEAFARVTSLKDRLPTLVGRLSPRVQDLNYPLFDDRVLEEGFLQVLARFCALNHCAYTVVPSGAFYVYTLKDAPFPDGLGGYQLAGYASPQDLRRARPSHYVTRFVKKHEVLVQSTSGTTTREGLSLEEVIQLPDTVTVPKLGLRWRGQWVKIVDALSAWNDEGWAGGEDLTYPKLLETAMSPHLLHRFALNHRLPGSYDPVQLNRLSVAANSLRRFWRLPPTLLHNVDTWELTALSFVDPESGEPQPSPVWMDYAIQPLGIRPTVADPASRLFTYNLPFPDKLADASVAPVDAVMKDGALGIIELVFRTDPYHAIAAYHYGTLVNPLRVGIPGSPLPGYIGSAKLSPTFNLAILLNVTLSSPNSSERYLEVETDAKAHGLTLPDVKRVAHQLYSREFARYVWRMDQSELQVGDNNELVLQGLTLQNEGILVALARAEAFRAFFSWADRVAGRLSRPGFDPDTDQLAGNVTRLTVSFGKVHETEYVATDRVPPVDALLLLPPLVRQRVHRTLITGESI